MRFICFTLYSRQKAKKKKKEHKEKSKHILFVLHGCVLIHALMMHRFD